MDRADLAELGSRLPENVQALGVREFGKSQDLLLGPYANWYNPAPFPMLSAWFPGSVIAIADERIERGEVVCMSSGKAKPVLMKAAIGGFADHPDVPMVRTAEEHERLTGRKWPV